MAISDQFHVRACLDAIEAGKHVLVEKPLGVGVEECEELRLRVPRLRPRPPGRQQPPVRPGHRLRRPLHPRGDGRRDGPQGVVLRLDLSLHHDRQPPANPRPGGRRPAARGGPQGRPAALLPPDPRQPPRRHGPLPGRADRGRPRPGPGAVRGLLLVRGGRPRQRRPRPLRPDHPDPRATSRRVSRSTASTAARPAGRSSPGTTRPARSNASPPATASSAGRWGRTPTPTSFKSRGSPRRSSTAPPWPARASTTG